MNKGKIYDEKPGVKPDWSKLRARPCQPRVTVMKGAIKYQTSTVMGLPRGPGGKRGKVEGWSPASRRRMRHFLATHYENPECWVGALTLTIPGPAVTVEEQAYVWERVSKCCRNNGIGMVWRMEVQPRKNCGGPQPHWHCLLVLPAIDADVFICNNTVKLNPFEIGQDRVAQAFRSAVDSLGPVEWGRYKDSGPLLRSHLSGAEKHMIKYEGLGDGGAWGRYLLDHTSKRKKAQEASGRGRHWGIVNRGMFIQKPVIGNFDWPEHQRVWRTPFYRKGKSEAAFQRYLRRWEKPRIYDDRDPVGWRLGYAPSYPGTGVFCRFVPPSLVNRLGAWALSLDVGTESASGGRDQHAGI